MNTLLASPSVAKLVPAAALEFAAGSGLPVLLDTPRTVDGRFASYMARDAVTPVVLPTGVTGWQVGPGGKIFAAHDAAVRFANVRRARMAQVISHN
jgi:hypothetical protein